VSLDVQRAKIAAWCNLNDTELVAVFEDAGISGASMNGREGLHAALKATGRGMALVSYSISRLARSTRDMLEIAERLDAKGADLVSLTEKIDTTTAAGRMVFKMLAVLADFERDQLAERTRQAMQHMRAQGRVVGAIPHGYQRDGDRLVQHDAEQRIVSLAAELRGQGMTLRAIADELAKRGAFNRAGRPFQPESIRGLLRAA
jgi:DNA invertase Pin-like site-specific DNA recombinase